MKITKALSNEQQEALVRARAELIEKVVSTMDVPTGYPLNAAGKPDLRADMIDIPVSRNDVEYLVDLYYAIRFNEGVGHDEAARRTYSHLYRGVAQRYAPHQAIAEIRARYGD